MRRRTLIPGGPALNCFWIPQTVTGYHAARIGEPRMAISTLAVETEREKDGRWLAEVPALPGTLAYGTTQEEAVARAEALALRVLAERLEHGEPVPELGALFAAA
jgi:predicted RNase H-like HicB family nuclease